MGEGPATVRVRDRKARRYAALAAATVMGAGFAVGASVTGANATRGTTARPAGSVALTNTSSITRFIEDNWLGGTRIGGGSYDAISGRLNGRNGLFNFDLFGPRGNSRRSSSTRPPGRSSEADPSHESMCRWSGQVSVPK